MTKSGERFYYNEVFTITFIAEVAELADALDSGSSVLFGRGGSSPLFGTLQYKDLRQIGVSPFLLRFEKTGAKRGQHWLCVGLASLVQIGPSA